MTFIIEKLKKQEGITLIEVLISLSILGIIIVPVYTLFITTVKINYSSMDKLTASNIAQKYMENIKSSNSLTDLEGEFFEGKYKVIVNIEPEKDYMFNVDEQEQTFQDILYDLKIVLDYDNSIKAYDKHDLLLPYSNLNQEINIMLEENSIILEDIHDIEVPISDENGQVKIELYGSSDIILNATNTSDNKELIFYFCRHINSNAKYYFNIIEGSITKYSNILISDRDNLYTHNYRLYKVLVTVLKNEKEIFTLTGYKSFLE